jgi:hypothetical protein
MKDLAVDRAANPRAAAEDRWASDEDEDDDEELEVNLIDRSEWIVSPFVRLLKHFTR